MPFNKNNYRYFAYRIHICYRYHVYNHETDSQVSVESYQSNNTDMNFVPSCIIENSESVENASDSSSEVESGACVAYRGTFSRSRI